MVLNDSGRKNKEKHKNIMIAAQFAASVRKKWKKKLTKLKS